MYPDYKYEGKMSDEALVLLEKIKRTGTKWIPDYEFAIAQELVKAGKITLNELTNPLWKEARII